MVLLYFDHCEELWGGSPATAAIADGIESKEIEEVNYENQESPGLGNESSPESESVGEDDSVSDNSVNPTTTNTLHQAKKRSTDFYIEHLQG